MKHLAQLYNELDQTSSIQLKTEALSQYFRTCDPQSAMWTIALFSHRHPKRIVNAKQLRRWAAELAGIPEWLFEESYHTVGDLAETISLLTQQKEISDKPLHIWIRELKELRHENEVFKRDYITRAWQQLDSTERFLFNKIITGGFRVGVSQKLITRSLALAWQTDENIIAHRLMGNPDPDSTTLQELLQPEAEEEITSRPYPFQLAHPWSGEEPGAIDKWQIEYKSDGIRAQLIHRKGECYIWSRGEELITTRFPEIATAALNLPDGTVLDGEILPCKDGHILGFSELQTRIGRKNITAKLLEEVPVVFISYDIAEADGKDIRQLSLRQRRQKLEQVLSSAPSAVIQLAEILTPDTWTAAKEIWQNSRAVQAEGLMIKNKESSYEPGRKKGNWYKWKVDPYTIDAVLTYAMKGHGRRANLYTDYTFSLWDGDELVTVTKAYSGLTDEELREADLFIKQNTIERFGPVSKVSACHVFELAFENVACSNRHKSGIAVRFPRILRWRRDKLPRDANTLDDLKKLCTTLPSQESPRQTWLNF